MHGHDVIFILKCGESLVLASFVLHKFEHSGEVIPVQQIRAKNTCLSSQHLLFINRMQGSYRQILIVRF